MRVFAQHSEDRCCSKAVLLLRFDRAVAMESILLDLSKLTEQLRNIKHLALLRNVGWWLMFDNFGSSVSEGWVVGELESLVEWMA